MESKSLKNTGSTQSNMQFPQNQNVRHIPIFVEGRDEPIINRNIDVPDSVDIKPKAQSTVNGLFERVKNFPVRGLNNEFTKSRSKSPGQHNHTQKSNNDIPRSHSENSPHFATNIPNNNTQPLLSGSSNQVPLQIPIKDDAIGKIQNIQKEVLEIMDKVENFNGCSKKDREYIFLDEMLTQNLLKLDTIDTEGSETIKHARRAAIKCINKCIEVLEAKVDANSTAQCSEMQGDNKSGMSNKTSSSATATAV